MATNTTHYQLIKPDSTDFYNVEDFNDNADTIDGELFKKANKVTSPTAGNIVKLTSSGDLADGGLAFSIVNGILRVTY